mmetsp:Transcript_30976/g.76244  ORF Transcript_30976/g.76244 Transcript_30976/m.76244 type:complete len:220 (-) Transcript_30976:122-781(-)
MVFRRQSVRSHGAVTRSRARVRSDASAGGVADPPHGGGRRSPVSQRHAAKAAVLLARADERGALGVAGGAGHVGGDQHAAVGHPDDGVRSLGQEAIHDGNVAHVAPDHERRGAIGCLALEQQAPGLHVGVRGKQQRYGRLVPSLRRQVERREATTSDLQVGSRAASQQNFDAVIVAARGCDAERIDGVVALCDHAADVRVGARRKCCEHTLRASHFGVV